MSRARDNANLGAQAGSGLDASDITTGVLPVGVTGGSGLNALSASNLSAGVVPDARMPNLTGDITTVEGAVATTIANDAVTGAKIENNPTIAGNLTVSGDIVPSTPLSHRNIIINGGMEINQRGDTDATSSDGYYGPDRYKKIAANLDNATIDISQETTATTDLPRTENGLMNYLRYDVNVVESAVIAGEMLGVRYNIEANDLSRLCYGSSTAKTAVLSFYVRSSEAGTYVVNLYQQDGNKGVSHPYTLVADTWTRVSFEIPANTSNQVDKNNLLGWEINWVVSKYNGTDTYQGGSADNSAWWSWANNKMFDGYSVSGTWLTDTSSTWDLTGVQLELGSNATPFEHRSYGEELRRCQRYYWEHNAVSTQPIQGAGYQNSTATMDISIFIPVPMRATPTVTTPNTVYIWKHNGYISQSGPTQSVYYWNPLSNHLYLVCTGWSGLSNGYVCAGYFDRIIAYAEL